MALPRSTLFLAVKWIPSTPSVEVTLPASKKSTFMKGGKRRELGAAQREGFEGDQLTVRPHYIAIGALITDAIAM
jgi:hypothetical protein